MAARHGDLPLTAGDGGATGFTTLAALRKVADTTPLRSILRIGGWPGLYVVADTSGLETWVYVEQLRDEMQRLIEPSGHLDARTMLLGQAPLSRRRLDP